MAGRDYVRPSAAELQVPAQWTENVADEPGGLDVADWWRHLGDIRTSSACLVF
jgi:hypothetical protein